jgi:ribosomal protein S18 acetylase RimI-like enzyme
MVLLSSLKFKEKDNDLSLTQTINKLTAESFLNENINLTVENTISENGFIGFIEINGKIVSCGFAREDTSKTNSKYKTMYIHTFSTDSEYRGNGYCEKLVKEFIQKFNKTHILYLTVRTELSNVNESAIRCYEKCGFIMLPEVYRDHYDGKNSCMIRVPIPSNKSKKKKKYSKKRK